jgi:hypothetical protein
MELKLLTNVFGRPAGFYCDAETWYGLNGISQFSKEIKLHFSDIGSNVRKVVNGYTIKQRKAEVLRRWWQISHYQT